MALFVLAAALTPVCAGAENCSMACCRHKAQPASHPADMPAGRPCGTQTADHSADNRSGCRFAKASAALPAGTECVPGVTAAVGPAVFKNPIEMIFQAPLNGSIKPRPPGTPLYLRLLTQLI